MEDEREEREAEEVVYRRFFQPIAAFEKIWLLVLLVCFCVGGALSYAHRKVSSLPPLTVDNCGDYLTIDLSLQNLNSAETRKYTGDCMVRIGVKEGYYVTDLQVVLSLRKTGVTFSDRYLYEFDVLSNGESFVETERVEIDLSVTTLTLEQWQYVEIAYEIVSVSGGLSYAE